MTTAVTTYEPPKRNTMMIKNLCPGLMEMGKIKIGNKGAVRKSASGADWQAPQKLDHFLITTMQRGQDNNFLRDENIHRRFGDKPTSIPVRLIYDDIALNFSTRYICYYGKTVFCSGDGETAQRLQPDRKTYQQIACPCERQDPRFAGDDGKGKGKCKINGILSVIIDGADAVGGVWKFRTTSYNSVVGILSSLALIQRITGGRLAGIPLNMTVTPKTVQDPIQGNQQTVYVVGLQFAGNMDILRSTGYQIAMDEAKHGISMARIEEDARLLITHTPTTGLGDDPIDDVIEEFYPEEVQVQTVVETTGETVNTATGEIVDTPREKKHRRTKAEIEASRQAEQAEQPQSEPLPGDDPPELSQVVDAEPVDGPSETETITTPETASTEDPTGATQQDDLF